MKKNSCAILSAEVRSLTVHLRGIVGLPKDIKELLVRHFRRLKGHLHDFRMPRFVGAHVLIGRIDRMPVRIAHRGVDYAAQLAKSLFHTPKASSSESCDLVHFIL